MMSLSRREITLALATGLVVLLGFSYWIAEERIEQWRANSEEMALYKRKIMVAERSLAQQDRLMQSLTELRDQVPAHRAEKDVTSQLLKQLQAMADKSGLDLGSLKPDKEKKLGELELYELTISCSYSGTLKALVQFLYDLQSQGAVLDVRTLSVTPMPKQQGMLRGKFVVDCAYSRMPPGSEESNTAEN